MQISLSLQAEFNKTGLCLVYTPDQSTFGVIDWNSYEPVDAKVIQSATEKLADKGVTGVPVKALPGAKGACSVEFSAPDVVIMTLK